MSTAGARGQVQARVDAVLEQIRSRGGRVTPVTLRVIEAMARHPTKRYRRSELVDVVSDLEAVAQSTVYRTLERLASHGVIQRSPNNDNGAVRFHLSRQGNEHLV